MVFRKNQVLGLVDVSRNSKQSISPPKAKTIQKNEEVKSTSRSYNSSTEFIVTHENYQIK